MTFRKRKYFTNETIDYLENSFKKANLDKEQVNKIFEWLSNPPRWTTIRSNRNMIFDSNKSLNLIQNFIDTFFNSLNELLDEKEKIKIFPKCKILRADIDECIVFNSYCTNTDIKYDIKEREKIVIIDIKCAQAVMRGADIFIPGIISLSLGAKCKDEVRIYADLDSKCLKGSDSNVYLSNNPDSVCFIGSGWLMLDRDDVFKNSELPKTGVGVKIKNLKDNYYIPSFEILDSSCFYPQNLPSIICAKVLDPKQGEYILDMCAAPGGKTTHLAQLVNNKSQIIAFDKIPSKITKLKDLCKKFNCCCIEPICQDATKLDFNIYKPESFDRILVDAPCSALGQRPLIFNNITVNQLRSYITYQRMILDNAVKLLKPGGILVYSTCTITLEENEEQVSWLINKYKNLSLITQEPFDLSSSKGLSCKGLSDNQLNMLQRFMPKPGDETDLESVFVDTNGFFIAKFKKE